MTTKPTPYPARFEDGKRLCDDCSMDPARVLSESGRRRCLDCAREAHIREERIRNRKSTEVA